MLIGRLVSEYRVLLARKTFPGKSIHTRDILEGET
jgi:hypothetical protein